MSRLLLPLSNQYFLVYSFQKLLQDVGTTGQGFERDIETERERQPDRQTDTKGGKKGGKVR
jgi:hypothetical protein